jgi:hypothetical protein
MHNEAITLMTWSVLMLKGWTVEVISHDQSSWRPRVRRQVFDVAIEDKGNAVAAVRHRTRASECSHIVAIEELTYCYGLSPGRIRPRRACAVPTQHNTRGGLHNDSPQDAVETSTATSSGS